ncbi:MAG: tetratricopeptide repeat protein [Candidatus Binatia bacterium]
MKLQTLIRLFLLLSPAAVWGDTAGPETSAMGCPRCKTESPEAAQLLKSAARLHAEFKPKEAVNELQKVLQREPQNFQAMAMLSRAYIDIGDSIPEGSPDWQARRMKEYKTAEAYARKAISIDPNSTWGHFYVAWSLGNVAMISPVEKQIDLAGEIRSAAEKAIALDPQNGFAYHAYGVWHRKMAEIGKMSRMVASVLYGRSIPSGSLEKSLEYLRKAVTLNPNVIVSRLELARTYVAMGDWAQARSFLKSLEALPVQFSDDRDHKQKAKQLLEEIKEHQG